VFYAHIPLLHGILVLTVACPCTAWSRLITDRSERTKMVPGLYTAWALQKESQVRGVRD
jgi:hypothetical protein